MGRGSGWAWLGGMALGLAAGYILPPLLTGARQPGPARRRRGAPAAGPGGPPAPHAESVDRNPWLAGNLDPEKEDERLAGRVRSLLPQLVAHPSQVHVDVVDSTVILRGVMYQHEIGPALVRLRGVPGVWEVESRLETVRALPGQTPRPAQRPILPARAAELRPEVRSSAVLVGMLLAWTGLRRGGLLGMVTAGVGGLLLLEMSGGRQGLAALPDAVTQDILAEASLEVHAPLPEVFAFWSNFRNFPRFMKHLREVKEDESGVSRWVADGPAGVPVSWKAEIVTLKPHHRIAWASLPGSTLRNRGEVRFEEVDANTTRITVRIIYHPPAGAVGRAVSAFLGADPEKQLQEDLARLKELLERKEVGPGDGSTSPTSSIQEEVGG